MKRRKPQAQGPMIILSSATRPQGDPASVRERRLIAALTDHEVRAHEDRCTERHDCLKAIKGDITKLVDTGEWLGVPGWADQQAERKPKAKKP